MRGRWVHHADEIAEELTWLYGDYAHGNLRDPLKELVYILCSTMTRENVYQRVSSDFFRRFPSRSAIREASESDLADALEAGGLGLVKAEGLRRTLDAIEAELGSLNLRKLDALPDDDLEAFYLSLPGVGRKVARCVMLYAHDREVFPVDTHCWRMAKRLGWIRPRRPDGACGPKDMDHLQSRIPPEHRFSLHVNMVSHGRAVCTARSPSCGTCEISQWCKRIHVSP